MKYLSTFLFIITISYNSFATSGSPDMRSESIDEACLMHPDLPALVALYNSTDGDHWINNTGWVIDDMNADPCNGWFGVYCQEGRVTSLSLNNNSLTGNIPQEIGELSEMKDLRMINNNLFGSVPGSLGNLDKAFIMYFMNNDLSGCFDENMLSKCGYTQVRFDNNENLTWAGDLQKFCETSGSLEDQNGAYCGLGGSGIIDDCECIKSAEPCYTKVGLLCMDWVQDLIEELPCYDYGFGQRHQYSFSVSKLDGEPIFVVNEGQEFASKVVSTTSVYTCGGELLEKCSFSLGTNCPDSVTIYSQLSPTPTQFYHCTDPSFPDCANLVQHPDFEALRQFFYSTNGLQWDDNSGWRAGVQEPFTNPCDGWLGVDCDNNNRVSSITLRSNNLTGTILPSFGDLTELSFLSIEQNMIEGSIPTEFSNLTKMVNLNMYANQFSGSIPSELKSMQNLEVLLLAFNNLEGEIPSALAEIEDLIVLNLAQNMLEGGLSLYFAGFTRLNVFDVTGNNLTGEIPIEFAQLNSLTSLGLGANQFSGEIPHGFFDDMSQLARLDLADNNFIGNLDEQLGNLAFMNALLLQNNNFSGCIPDSYSNLCNVAVDLSGNPLLPWEGDYMQYCESTDQIGAPCDDGDGGNGTTDEILEDCDCGPKPVSVNDARISTITVYPNPTKDQVRVESSEGVFSQYTVTDVLGNVVSKSSMMDNIIDMSMYAEGVYFVRFYSIDREFFELVKVIKI